MSEINKLATGSSNSGIPKIPKLGGGLKSTIGLPKIGSSASIPKLDPIKPKPAPAPAPVDEPAAPAPVAEPAPIAEPAPVAPAPVDDASDVSTLIHDIDESDKTMVQSTDDFLNALLLSSDTAIDDDDWSVEGLNSSQMNPSVKSNIDIPAAPAPAEIPAPPAHSNDVGVASIKISTPSVEIAVPPAATAPASYPGLDSLQNADPRVATPTIGATAAPAYPAPATSASAVSTPSGATVPVPPTPVAPVAVPAPAAPVVPTAAPVSVPTAATVPAPPAAPTPVPPASSIPTTPQVAAPAQPTKTAEEIMLENMSDEERAAYEEEQMLQLMTPEERAEYEKEKACEGMTPEERAAYEEQLRYENMTPTERHNYEMQMQRKAQEEEERHFQKKQEMYNQYMADQAKPKSSNAGLYVIIIIVIAALAIGGVFAFKASQDAKAALEAQRIAEEKAAAEEAAKSPKETVSEYRIDWYDVDIDCPSDATVYVNGVELKSGSKAKFAKDHNNMVVAYQDGLVPFFASFGHKDTPDSVKCEFDSDELYLKTNLEFKFKDASILEYDLKATFDGRTINRFGAGEIKDVVMGRPHTLILQKPGYAPHMHIIWPSKRPTSTVQIPAFQTENNAKGGSILDIKPFPSSPEPYGLRIRMGETVYSSPSVVTASHGAFVEYSIARKQRFPLMFGVYPDAYGTVNFDTDLLPEPLGEAIVSYKSLGKDSIQLCFRREGELYCPSKEGQTTLPSGKGWEVIGYIGEGGSKTILKGGYGQDLSTRRIYEYSVDVGPGRSLIFNQNKVDVIPKADAAKKK